MKNNSGETIFMEVNKMGDIGKLMVLVEELAHSREHYTILKFSSHWKSMWGTPNLNDGSGRVEVENLEEHGSLESALLDLIYQALAVKI